MTKKQAELLEPARPTQELLSWSAFLDKLAAKDRANVEKHIAAAEAEADSSHAALWKKIAAGLMSLSRHSVKVNGVSSAQFYTADGKYRMQVFALEDPHAGTLNVYCSDVLDAAVKAGIVNAPKRGEVPGVYHVPDSTMTLTIERLDSNLEDPSPFFKEMLGWNRRALRIILPITAASAQLKAVKGLCALSVKETEAPNW